MRLRYLNRRGLRLLTEPWYRYGTTPFTSVLAERQQALIRRIGWVFRFGIRTVLAEAGVAASRPALVHPPTVQTPSARWLPGCRHCALRCGWWSSERSTAAYRRSAAARGRPGVRNEIGLDHYEVRRYDSWQRHITLALLAHTFLADLRRQAVGGRPAPGAGPRRSAGPPQRARSTSTAGSGLAAAGTVPDGAPRLVGLASAPPSHRPTRPLPSSVLRPRSAEVRL